MGRKASIKSDPKKLAIAFQVTPDISSNIIATFASLGGGLQPEDSDFGLNPNSDPGSLGSLIEQLTFEDSRTLGVGAVTTLSSAATKMVGLHVEGEIEVANISVPLEPGDEAPTGFPFAQPADQVVQAYVDVIVYQVQATQSPVIQTYAGFQPNKFSPLYSPEKKLLLSAVGIVSVMQGNSNKMTVDLRTKVGRNFEKADGVGLVIISRATEGSATQQVPLTCNMSLVFWLQN